MKGKFNRPVLMAGMVSASLLIAANVNAVMVDTFDVTAGGGWVVTSETPTCDADGVGGSAAGGDCVDESIAGGLPGTFLTIAWEDGGDPQSSLTVDWDPGVGALDATGTQVVTTNGAAEATSIIAHENITINPFNDHVNRLQLAQSFMVDVSAGDASGGVITGGPLVLPTVIYDVQFAETLNAGVPCEAGGGNPCQDIFIIRNLAQVLPDGPIPFEVCDGATGTECWNHELTIDIEGLVQTTAGQLALDFPDLTIDPLPDDQAIGYLITQEGLINTVTTTVAITATHEPPPTDAPEPAGLAVVGLGLVVAGVARVRRRR